MENETVTPPNGEEVVTPDVTTEESTETVEEVKARLEAAEKKAQKAEELANNYKIRAEKAEKGVKAAPQVKATEENGLSTKDVLALSKANVHEDDLDEVLEYARFKKIPVMDALKNPVVKATLAEKAEQRRVASAANVGTSKRGSGKISDDAILDNAAKGKIPESEDGIGNLIAARRNKLLKK